MLEQVGRDLLAQLKACPDRRTTRVMVAQMQVHLVNSKMDAALRDRFWKALFTAIRAASHEFVAADVFATVMADVTLQSIRCAKNSQIGDD